MAKTKFESYCNKDVAEGCKYCVRGEKLVLFMGGKCSRKCWYCSLSENRKDALQAFANERPVTCSEEIIEEAKISNAKGAGITGGDPLVYFDKTIEYASALKKEFGEDFHIHIYLPLVLVTEEKLRKLKSCVDEVRFHPSFLAEKNNELKEEEFEKIKMASEIFGVANTGIEVPMIPEKKVELYEFIKRLEGIISFANLNEFELSETNFDRMVAEYSLNEDTYTVRDSLTVGRQIVRQAINDNFDINVHLCTARTKDCYQYINRLLKHEILPYGNRTDEGTVVYFIVEYELNDNIEEKLRGVTKKFYNDKERKRFIVDMDEVEKVYEKTDLKIARIEEHPTWGNERLEYGLIGKE